jgi:hypothetical protein
VPGATCRACAIPKSMQSREGHLGLARNSYRAEGGQSRTVRQDAPISRRLLADLLGAFNRYPNIYGIRAVDCCRARHFNLFGQRQRQTVR